MFVIPIDPKNRNYEVSQILEIETLEKWAEERNKRLAEMGLLNNQHFAAFEHRVEHVYCGKIKMRYVACDKDPFRLHELPIY